MGRALQFTLLTGGDSRLPDLFQPGLLRMSLKKGTASRALHQKIQVPKAAQKIVLMEQNQRREKSLPEGAESAKLVELSRIKFKKVCHQDQLQWGLTETGLLGKGHRLRFIKCLCPLVDKLVVCIILKPWTLQLWWVVCGTRIWFSFMGDDVRVMS
ncbi:hypothetical protein ACFX11_002520 [Malus domestica]